MPQGSEKDKGKKKKKKKKKQVKQTYTNTQIDGKIGFFKSNIYSNQRNAFLFVLRAEHAGYGTSWVRGQIRATAAGL